MPSKPPIKSPRKKTTTKAIKAPPVPETRATPPAPLAPEKTPINVAVERRLIDSKIGVADVPPSKRLLSIAAYAIIFGGLAGAAMIFYLRITQFDEGSTANIPKIEVPAGDTVSDAETPPPGGPATTTDESTVPLTPVRVVEILDTPTGFLNVRKGPGTNFAKIIEAKPGEAYILVSVDEEKGWYEIRLADGTTGWVTKQYARVK